MNTHAKLIAAITVSTKLACLMGDAGQQMTEQLAMQEGQQTEQVARNVAKVVLKGGTEVHLKLAETLTSKTAVAGERVEFVLVEDLKVGEDIVVRKGTRALGTVVEGKKSEKQKQEAKQLSMSFDHMKVGDSFIKLRGEQSGTGKRDAAKMVTFGILFGVSGLLAASGKKFVIAEGTPATAYVDQDIELPILRADAR